MDKKMIKNQKGQMLVAILLASMVLAIMIPVVIMWLNREAVWTVKEQKSTVAYNLAEAGIQRGVWKLKSSTAAWTQASKGEVIPGYNFDISYEDISGGKYRIKFSSGPDSKSVTILSEGQSYSPQETRAIRAVYKNQTIPGAMITKGIITWANAFSAHWGPIMAHNNITITDANAAKDYFPRKFSRQVVSCNQAGYPRDQNGLLPPNTDSSGADEWYSDYPVPDLPELNWDALRSSAAVNMATYCEYDGEDSSYWYYRWKQGYPLGSPPPANWISSATINTLNVHACSSMNSYTGPKWWIRYRKRKTTGVISEAATLSTCNLTPGQNHDGLRHFQNPWRHPLALMNRVWYWDPGAVVTFTGSTGENGCGIYGNVIVRGDLKNYCGDNYKFTGDVPSEAWMEYKKIHQSGANSTWDTAAVNQYPADDGFRKNRATFKFGEETWTAGQNPPTAENTDVGLRGFLYVGGNYDIQSAMDIYGAVWVEGNVSRATGAEMTIIFFNENLDLPSLNVVLVRKSWDEVIPSTIPWP